MIFFLKSDFTFLNKNFNFHNAWIEQIKEKNELFHLFIFLQIYIALYIFI